MPSIIKEPDVFWRNYHKSIGTPISDAYPVPEITVRHMASLSAGDIADQPGLQRMAQTARKIQDYLSESIATMAKERSDIERPITAPYAFGTTGKSWSFASLIGTSGWQFDTSGLSGCNALTPSELHPLCTIAIDKIAMVSGGSRLREIADWAKARNMMISNSGTHLGPSIAGAFGTASHGSLLGKGGIQNMVHGMHIITGPDSSFWIERAGHPILADAAIAALGARAIRDSAMFEDVLIHLGGMGIINAVAIELVPKSLYCEMRIDKPITDDWFELASTGNFRAISEWLVAGKAPEFADHRPAFYETTFDPFDYTGQSALHIVYFDAAPGAMPTDEDTPIARTGDAVAGFAKNVASDPLWLQQFFAGKVLKEKEPDPLDINIYQYYRTIGGFIQGVMPQAATAKDWSQLHSDVITGGQPGALYNASYALECRQLPMALAAITKVITDNFPAEASLFVFTVRFIANPAGTMAFTRFAQSAIIEIDGLSPLFLKQRLLEAGYPPSKLPENVVNILPNAAMAVRGALDAAGISYSMHWAKLGNLDAAKNPARFWPCARSAKHSDPA